MIGFNDWTITEKEYDWLIQFCQKHSVRNVIEFGTGMSTMAFLQAGCNVHSFETDEAYLAKIKTEILRQAGKHDRIVLFSEYNEKNWLRRLKSERFCFDSNFDFAFVDGPMGKVWTPSRINTAMFCCARFPLIGFHDTNRDRERHTLGIFLSMGFEIVDQFTDDLGLIVIKPPCLQV